MGLGPYPRTDEETAGKLKRKKRSDFRQAARDFFQSIRGLETRKERFEKLLALNQRVLELQTDAHKNGQHFPVLMVHDKGFHVAHGFSYEDLEYDKRSRDAYNVDRDGFDANSQAPRAEFVRFLAEHKKRELQEAGFNDTQIEEIFAKGETPEGWEIHHRIPLDDGGTNNRDNLILMKAVPEHDAVHEAYTIFNQLIRRLKVGDVARIAFPVPVKGVVVCPDRPKGTGSVWFEPIPFEEGMRLMEAIL